MKALRSHTPGGPDTLTLDEVDAPRPGPGEVLVSVKAAGVNFLDTLIIQDLYQAKPPRPFAPGAEAAGVIEAVGEGVSGWKPGDRVVALPAYGAMAEKVVVPQNRVFTLPDGLDFDTAAGLLITYGTSLHALADRAGLRDGETLLVLGAAGGAGLSAVEIGKAMGARVIAGVSSEEKAAIARSAGADEVVIYDRAPFDRDQSRQLGAALKQACGPGGCDVVYDAVGGDYSEPAFRTLGWQGRFLVIGFAAGMASLPLNLPLLKSSDIRGVFFGGALEQQPDRIARTIADLFAMIGDGRITPRAPNIYPFDRGGDAIASLGDRKALGKVVIHVGD